MACLLEEMNREKARVGVRTIEEGKEGRKERDCVVVIVADPKERQKDR